MLAPAFLSQQNLPVRFNDVATKIGVTFKHENGASPDKPMPETMSAGAIIFDYNNDGWPDLFFVNGGSFVDKQVAAGARHRLYRNTGDGKFTDVTESSGIGVFGFGMGACAADYDNDGWTDLYVTAVGANKLYHNTGKNGFTDVTDSAGVGAGLWSTSCAFGDIDNDGDVDLYVARYVDFAADNKKVCMLFQDVRSYCHPNVYSSVPDILYRNNGRRNIYRYQPAKPGSAQWPAMGLASYSAITTTMGGSISMWRTTRRPTFCFTTRERVFLRKSGFWAGTAVGVDGKALAGMGTDMADMNGDGLLDIFVTNLDGQTHSLYKNLGKGLFTNVTFPSGVG